jgi:hypothetical protein
MRTSGEAKHQALSKEQSAAFGVIDTLTENKALPEGWDHMGDSEKSKLIDSIAAQIDRSISSFRKC